MHLFSISSSFDSIEVMNLVIYVHVFVSASICRYIEQILIACC